MQRDGLPPIGQWAPAQRNINRTQSRWLVGKLKDSCREGNRLALPGILTRKNRMMELEDGILIAHPLNALEYCVCFTKGRKHHGRFRTKVYSDTIITDTVW